VNPTKLAIFDFDGTLFRSPEPPEDWDESLWYDINSLAPPIVPKVPGPEWWVQTVVAAAKLAQESEPTTRTVLMTGRSDGIYNTRIHELLFQAGLDFHEVHLNPGRNVLDFKMRAIGDILENHPSIREAEAWDDHEENLQAFEVFMAGKRVPLLTHWIQVATRFKRLG
jgi:hypothetical protein